MVHPTVLLRPASNAQSSMAQIIALLPTAMLGGILWIDVGAGGGIVVFYDPPADGVGPGEDGVDLAADDVEVEVGSSEMRDEEKGDEEGQEWNVEEHG